MKQDNRDEENTAAYYKEFYKKWEDSLDKGGILCYVNNRRGVKCRIRIIIGRVDTGNHRFKDTQDDNWAFAKPLSIEQVEEYFATFRDQAGRVYLNM